MKISRRRDGGILIAIAGDELQQMLGWGAEHMKRDRHGVTMEVTNRIHYQLTEFLFPPARVESEPIFTPLPPKNP